MEANELAQLLLPSLLAAIGGLVWQLYTVVELDKPFSLAGCVAYMVSAAAVGYAVADFLREDFRGRHALIMAAGTMPYAVLALFRKMLRKHLDVGGPDGEGDKA